MCASSTVQSQDPEHGRVISETRVPRSNEYRTTIDGAVERDGRAVREQHHFSTGHGLDKTERNGTARRSVTNRSRRAGGRTVAGTVSAVAGHATVVYQYRECVHALHVTRFRGPLSPYDDNDVINIITILIYIYCVLYSDIHVVRCDYEPFRFHRTTNRTVGNSRFPSTLASPTPLHPDSAERRANELSTFVLFVLSVLHSSHPSIRRVCACTFWNRFPDDPAVVRLFFNLSATLRISQYCAVPPQQQP